ncbi:phosphotransferase [Thalassotalea ponticola]|uniref:phosphotransferase n=1 Tax=Thalassotalea ponticola TaxID=1523392 RepID=UPI0025B35CCF|nr:phosphotransferase [Thalassotalea ponticola]MDN3651539.1 phosphotransferase [Thalassotalea ponticola]
MSIWYHAENARPILKTLLAHANDVSVFSDGISHNSYRIEVSPETINKALNKVLNTGADKQLNNCNPSDLQTELHRLLVNLTCAINQSKPTPENRVNLVVKVYHPVDSMAPLSLWQQASHADLAPKIYYHNFQEGVVISEFIDGVNLNRSQLSVEQKVSATVAQVARLHRLNCQLSPLDIPELTEQLALSARGGLRRINKTLGDVTTRATQLVSTLDNQVHRWVSCHGDLNFNNVLSTDRFCLIDFDCAVSAEPEWDIAMMIAINDLPQKYIVASCHCYNQQKLPIQPTVTAEKVTRYLDICRLINGLWFLSVNDEQLRPKQRRWAHRQIKQALTLW